MVACLERSDENVEFHHIVDFLTTSSIHYALTVSPTIYVSYIKKFWATVKSKTVNDVKQIHATVDGKTVVISKSSVRSDLHFNDEDGITCLSNDEIFVNLALMGYEGVSSKLTFKKLSFPLNGREENRVVRAATIASSLEAEQESGNIHKTRPTTTLNEPSPQGLGSGSGPRRQDTTLGGADAQTRFETASKKSYDPPLSKGNTSGSGEDSMEHPVDLMDFVPPTPHDSPLLGGHTPGSDEDCSRLGDPKAEKRVKRLEKALRARTPGMKLFKIGTSKRKGLDKENVSKQGRKSDKTKPMFNDSDFDVLDDALENVKGGSIDEQITTVGDTLIMCINVRVAVLFNLYSTARPLIVNVVVFYKNQVRATPVPKLQSLDKDKLLAERLQQEEREQFTVDEQARILVDLIAERKKFFATQRAEQIRNKPPTRAQLRNKMVPYLKHMVARRMVIVKSKQKVVRRDQENMMEEGQEAEKLVDETEREEIFKGLVKRRDETKQAQKGYGLVALGRFKRIYGASEEDEIWKNQQDYNLIRMMIIRLHNVDGSVKFLMYPRFVQVFLDKQVGDMSNHDEIFVIPSHTKKVFGNMKRVRKGFSRAVTPLFPTMTVQAQEEIEPIAYEVANEENVPTQSNDSPLSRVNTLGSGEDRLKLKELIDLYTKLSDKVLDLETIKTAQAKEISCLKLRVKRWKAISEKDTEEVVSILKLVLLQKFTIEEISLAQALAELRSAKPKVVVQEPVHSTTTIAPSIIPKAKSITFRDPGESTTRPTLTPIPSNIKDKGKAKMIELENPLKMKEQIRLDEELAFKLQAKEEEQARLAREKAKKVEEANISWDNVQAMIEAERLQAREQEELTNKEKARLFVELLEERKKHFVALRAQEKRNKPPTKLFDKAMTRVNMFGDKDIELVKESSKKAEAEMAKESSSKSAGEELEQEVAKKHKMEDDKEKEDLKQCFKIV
ncbi:hypothetical protein Tco_0572353 [Tanacetum coccineum]